MTEQEFYNKDLLELKYRMEDLIKIAEYNQAEKIRNKKDEMDILFKILFELRKEVNELKRQIKNRGFA